MAAVLYRPATRLAQARRHLSWVESRDFLKFLSRMLGLHPLMSKSQPLAHGAFFWPH
jgi:hypothetical protein